MMEIVINQHDNQTIRISNDNIQFIDISQNDNQNINIENNLPQDIELKQKENQVVLITGGGNIVGISDVLVNGISVVDGNIAYVIVPTKTSELLNDSGFITNETDPTVPTYVKQISLADINNWNNKQNVLVSGSTIKTINNTSLLGSGNLNIEGTVYSAGTGININASNEISNTIVSYNDLEDLPEIPTKTSDLTNDSDYVTENELSDVAFSGSYADLSNIPVIPDSTSDLINDSGFIDKDVNDLTYYTKTADLGTVALSNDYTDLINKPTIPTVNDGTLTIQQNGTNVETFTANSSTNKTANITVPTKTSDLTNDSGFITNKYYEYSTDEKRIGTWINGKPLYSRTFGFNNLSLNQETVLNWNNTIYGGSALSNVDEIINYEAFYKRSDNTFQIIPNVHADSSAWGCGVYDLNGNSFTFWVGSLYGVFSINYLIITIKYTKTTD